MAPGFTFNIPFKDGNCLLPLAVKESTRKEVLEVEAVAFVAQGWWMST